MPFEVLVNKKAAVRTPRAPRTLANASVHKVRNGTLRIRIGLKAPLVELHKLSAGERVSVGIGRGDDNGIILLRYPEQDDKPGLALKGAKGGKNLSLSLPQSVYPTLVEHKRTAVEVTTHEQDGGLILAIALPGQWLKATK